MHQLFNEVKSFSCAPHGHVNRMTVVGIATNCQVCNDDMLGFLAEYSYDVLSTEMVSVIDITSDHLLLLSTY